MFVLLAFCQSRWTVSWLGLFELLGLCRRTGSVVVLADRPASRPGGGTGGCFLAGRGRRRRRARVRACGRSFGRRAGGRAGGGGWAGGGVPIKIYGLAPRRYDVAHAWQSACYLLRPPGKHGRSIGMLRTFLRPPTWSHVAGTHAGVA